MEVRFRLSRSARPVDEAKAGIGWQRRPGTPIRWATHWQARGRPLFRGFVAGVLATIVSALVGGYIVLRSRLIPTNADAKPVQLETWAVNTSLQTTLPPEAPKGPNPVALIDENLITGIDLYRQHCAICHGTAKGEASASPVAKGE